MDGNNVVCNRAANGRVESANSLQLKFEMFRISPWITYDPSPDARNNPLERSNVHFHNMNEDVEMDAPQISTLREEETPEPQPTPSRTSKFRVKLLVNEGKRASSLASSSSRKHPHGDSDDEDESEEEEEEDQLIDDDDDAKPAPTAPAPLVIPPSTRGSPVKRGRGGGRGGKRKSGRGTAPVHEKLMTWVGLPETVSAVPQPPQGEVWEVTSGTTTPSAPVPSVGRKRGGAPKGTGARAIRKKAAKCVSLCL